MKHGMRFYPKLNKYKSSNLVYDIETETAYSYDWYVIAKRFKGTMILNSYSYSSTTIRHYYKLRDLFETLGIKYIYIEAPKGLQDLERAKEHYKEMIQTLQTQINKPRSNTMKNYEREAVIRTHRVALGFIEFLQIIREIKS